MRNHKGLVAALEDHTVVDDIDTVTLDIEDHTSDIQELKEADYAIESAIHDLSTLQRLANIQAKQLRQSKPLDLTSMRLSKIAVESITSKIGLESCYSNLSLESYTDDLSISKEAFQGLTNAVKSIFEAILRVLKWLRDKAKDLWRNYTQKVETLTDKQKILTKLVSGLDDRGQSVPESFLDSATVNVLTKRFSVSDKPYDFKDVMAIIRNTETLLNVSTACSEEWDKVINGIKDSLSDNHKLVDKVTQYNKGYISIFEHALTKVDSKDPKVPYQAELGPLLENHYFTAIEHVVQYEGKDVEFDDHDLLKSMVFGLEARTADKVSNLRPLTKQQMENLMQLANIVLKGLENFKKVERSSNSANLKLEASINLILKAREKAHDIDKTDIGVEYNIVASLYRDIQHNMNEVILDVSELAFHTVSSIHQYVALSARNYTPIEV